MTFFFFTFYSSTVFFFFFTNCLYSVKELNQYVRQRFVVFLFFALVLNVNDLTTSTPFASQGVSLPVQAEERTQRRLGALVFGRGGLGFHRHSRGGAVVAAEGAGCGPERPHAAAAHHHGQVAPRHQHGRAAAAACAHQPHALAVTRSAL